MTRVEMLEKRLDEAFMSGRFHSFLASIGGVSDEDARWIPPHYRGFPHMDGSILNLAFHCGGDKHVLMSSAFGDGSITWDTITDRFRELGGDLRAARTIAESGHSLVLATLQGTGEEGLDVDRPYYSGRSLTAYEVFSIVAEHDIYHAGQINYVRNLLAGGAR